MSQKKATSNAEKIKLAKTRLDNIIKELEKDGLTEAEKAKIKKAKQAFENFKKELAKKQAAKKSGGGIVSFPAFMPKLKFKNGETTVQKEYKMDLHPKIAKQKTFPVPSIPGLEIGGELSLESKASLILALTKTNTSITSPPFTSANYKVDITLGLSSTGAAKIVLTDAAKTVAAKFGLALRLGFQDKKIQVTNFFEKGEFTLNMISIDCFVTGSIGAGTNLNDVYKLIYDKDMPPLFKYDGKKYKLLAIGTTVKMVKGNMVPNKPNFVKGPGWAELQKDINSAMNTLYDKFGEFSDTVIDTAMKTIPVLVLAQMAYDALCGAYDSWKSRHFRANKSIYEKACRAAIKEMMKRERKDPKKMKALAAVHKDKDKLKKHYESYMKSAQNIPLIKQIHADLTANRLDDAQRGLEHISTTIGLKMHGAPTIVKKSDDLYKFNFDLHIKTDGAVTIPVIKTYLFCDGLIVDIEHEDKNDRYDGPTDQAYTGYSLDISKKKVEEYLKGKKKYSDARWRLRLSINFKGTFKDINVYEDVTKYIKL